MLDHIICFLICARVQVTTYAKVTQPTQTYAQETLTTTPQVRQVDSGRTSQANQTRNTTALQDSSRVQEAQIIQEIHKVFREKASEAESVFRCESNLRANAASRTGDFGIGQINLKAHWNKIRGETREDKIANLFSPSYNLSFAYSLYARQSWLPWRSSFKCHGII